MWGTIPLSDRAEGLVIVSTRVLARKMNQSDASNDKAASKEIVADLIGSGASHDPGYRVQDELEISIKEVFLTLWRAKWSILVVVFLAGLMSVYVAVRLPNIYKSEALLAPAEESSGGGLSALASQFGGLASLAGVNIGKGDADKVTIGIEVMKSRSFLMEFIRKREILVPLVAGKGWDKATDTIILDSEIYNQDTGKWVGKYLEMPSKSPTDLEAYNKLSDLLQINRSKDTGLINVSLTHYSPIVAKTWLDWLIEDANSKMRMREIDEASKIIAYLRKQLDQTALAGMQQIFFQLIEKQMQTIMLAKVRDQYVFKIIDPPVVADDKIAPKRIMIVLLSMVVSAFLMVVIVLAKNGIRRS